MKRTLNFTDRKRIGRKYLTVTVDDDSGTFRVDVDADFTEMPAGAEVIVEAYERTLYERHKLGTLPGSVSGGPFRFERVRPDSAMFRIKVIDQRGEGAGRLLGVADRISPEGTPGTGSASPGMERRSLLHARPAALDGQLWRVSFDAIGFPVLEYEESLAARGFRSFIKSDPHFMALVMPGVARQILTHVLFVDPQEDLDDGSWPAEWLRVGADWCHAPAPVADDPPEAKLLWIDNVITAVSTRLEVVDLAEKFLSEDSE